MPFNIEYKNKDNEFGRLTIDRNNLIFQCIPLGEDQESWIKAFCRRCELDEEFSRIKQESFPGLRSLAVSSRAIHLIDDHVVQRDVELPHAHFKFNQLIDFKIFNDFLNNFSLILMDKLMTEADKDFVMNAVEQYFLELNNDPAAAEREFEYHLEKQSEFCHEVLVWNKYKEKLQIELEKEERLYPIEPSLSMPAILFRSPAALPPQIAPTEKGEKHDAKRRRIR